MHLCLSAKSSSEVACGELCCKGRIVHASALVLEAAEGATARVFSHMRPDAYPCSLDLRLVDIAIRGSPDSAGKRHSESWELVAKATAAKTRFRSCLISVQAIVTLRQLGLASWPPREGEN